MRDVGDGAARKLGQLLRGLPCNVNLIPVNPGAHGYARPSEREQAGFRRALEREGLDAVIR
jgi:23S rRNA (adenine2503-C2)-methyltransferase